MENFLEVPEEWRQAVKKAKSAALKAYAPYSNFRVGAAVEASGTIVQGTNVENATYGATVCAERIAIANARLADMQTIDRMALSFPDAPTSAGISTLVPCGICRQWLAELGPNCDIFVADYNLVFSISELFPYPFVLHT